jgi:hypothetical protein
MTEILLKVALNTITHPQFSKANGSFMLRLSWCWKRKAWQGTMSILLSVGALKRDLEGQTKE